MSRKTMPSDAGNIHEIIEKELSSLHPDYPNRMKKNPDRWKLDWELCGLGLLSEADLLAVYSRVSGIPLKNDEEIRDGDIIPFPGISSEYLNRSACLPIWWNDEEMEFLVCEPYTTGKIAYFARSLYGRKAKFSLARRSVLERRIQSVYEKSQTASENDHGQFLKADDSEETLRNLASEARTVRLVNEMFSRAMEMDASDIHIEPEEDKLAVRFRIDGLLQEFMTATISQYPAIVSRIKLVGGLNIAERRLPQDGRTNMKIGRGELDVRISTIPTMNGESVVLRLLRKDAMIIDLKSIGMKDEMRRKFEKLISLPHGIILVVGPTGSGKTTTLYGAMSKLNSRDRKIITIEDPVEYRIGSLSQMQVNPKIGLDFANSLRHIVRQDPDIILVGEIRDRETAEIAVHASLTGHLVLSTLHTNDAVGAVSRLLDMGVEGFLISSSLKAVLSQRLVRKICQKCGGSGTDKDSARCRNCSGTGFRGRTGIFELLVVDEEIASAISRNSDSATIANLAKKNGMKALVEDGMEKVTEGITMESEITRVTINI
jgi:type II secretory ATPase GspE/PulE/Tfp pilus assembly ATPase PilB-like protein